MRRRPRTSEVRCSEYMLLVYQEEVEPSEQAEREKEMPIFVELHRGRVRQGCWWRQRLVDRARRRSGAEGETEITDGPFAVTKEVLADATTSSTVPTSTRRSSRRRGSRPHAGGRWRCGRSWRPTSGCAYRARPAPTCPTRRSKTWHERRRSARRPGLRRGRASVPRRARDRAGHLIRQAGDFQVAEDAVQDAFEAAVTAWRRDGVPANLGRGSPPQQGDGRSTVCAATGRWRIVPSGWRS